MLQIRKRYRKQQMQLARRNVKHVTKKDKENHRCKYTEHLIVLFKTGRE